MAETTGGRQRVAVIGSGISGLSAAWLVSRSADVTLYEKSPKLGGHTCTVDVPGPEADAGRSTAVDMGFIVYNEATYPNLTALFRHLGVATRTTDMSLAVSLDGGRREYGGGTLAQLFAQPSNAVSPRFWSMLRDLVRFYRTAVGDIDALTERGITLGDYLAERRYGDAFVQDHLLPMAAAIWSMPTTDVLAYPAHAFIRFHDNHGLLKLANRPLWRTVAGGSRNYIGELTSEFAAGIRTGTGVRAVERTGDGVLVHDAHGHTERFDHAVIATHADQALALLAEPTLEERHLLGAFRYSANTAILHSDPGLMPRRRRAWASWNYLADNRHKAEAALTVTYWMNSLQALPDDVALFVTLNPNRPIDPATIHWSQHFEHPIIDTAATEAQQQLWSLQGAGGVWYCGAHFGAGFHEDGLQSGLAVAEAIAGVKRPWQVENESGRIVVGPAAPQRALEGVPA